MAVRAADQGRHTRIVTLPLANPITGTVPDVRAIADRAHDVGALVVVNPGAAPPHMPIDMAALGADVVSVSMPAFGGPTLAALVTRPGLLTELAGDTAPVRPERFELYPLPVELMDGVTAAVDHLANLDDAATGTRRQRLLRPPSRPPAAHEQQLYAQLLSQLLRLRGVTVIGSPEHRVPVAAFTVRGHSTRQVADHLAPARRRGLDGPARPTPS